MIERFLWDRRHHCPAYHLCSFDSIGSELPLNLFCRPGTIVDVAPSLFRAVKGCSCYRGEFETPRSPIGICRC